MSQVKTGNTSDVPSSPEDGGNFRRNLEIDMKGLIGDAVGNVSLLVHAKLAIRQKLRMLMREALLR